MTYYLLEDSSAVIILAILSQAILGICLAQTRRGIFALAMGGVLVILMGLIVLEIYVSTDREQVENTVWQLAADLQSNDAAAVVAHIEPTSYSLIGQAKGAFHLYQIDKAKVRDLEVRLISPQAAEAEFIGVLHGKAKSGLVRDAPGVFRQRLVLHFRRDARESAWLLHKYDRKKSSQGNPLLAP